MSKFDGGPAFPTAPIENRNGDVQYGEDGMTLRDYFAAKAMQALVQSWEGGTERDIALTAYSYADALLAARSNDK